MEEIMTDKTTTMPEGSLREPIEIDPTMPPEFTELEAQYGVTVDPLKEQFTIQTYRNSLLNYRLGQIVGMLQGLEVDKQYGVVAKWIEFTESESNYGEID